MRSWAWELLKDFIHLAENGPVSSKEYYYKELEDAYLAHESGLK